MFHESITNVVLSKLNRAITTDKLFKLHETIKTVVISRYVKLYKRTAL